MEFDRKKSSHQKGAQLLRSVAENPNLKKSGLNQKEKTAVYLLCEWRNWIVIS